MTSRYGIQWFAIACIVISTGLAANGGVSGISTGATLQAGDGYTITVTGSPNQPVTISWNKNGSSYGTPNSYAGNTNGSGVLTFSGTAQAGDIGDWFEYYYVNGASVGTLQFMIRQTPGSGACSSIPWGTACIHGITQGANWDGNSIFYGDAKICSDSACGSVLNSIHQLHDLGGGNTADFQWVNSVGTFYTRMSDQPTGLYYTWDVQYTTGVQTQQGKIYTLNSGQYITASCTALGNQNHWGICHP